MKSNSEPQQQSPALEELAPPERELFELYREGFQLRVDEATRHKDSVDELASEMTDPEIAATLKKMAYLSIQSADTIINREIRRGRDVEVDFSKIGWLKQSGTAIFRAIEASPYKGETKQRNVYLVDMTTMTPATRDAVEKLSAQTDSSGGNVYDKVMDQLSERILPQLCGNILSGQNLRPVNNHKGNRNGSIDRVIDTEYPTYKESVLGTNNRALISVLDSNDEQMVFGLVALYDHEESQQIYNVLSSHTSRKK